MTTMVSKEKAMIIIPTYNEALVIADTLHQVFAATESLEDVAVEILVFDSASTDATQKIVQELQAIYSGKLHLQTEAAKSGLGSAYAQAMQYALQTLDADIVVEFDADLSHQPKFLGPMMMHIKTCDVVLGSRYVKGGSIPKDWAAHRKFLSVLGNMIARFVLTWRYQDFTSGFRATRREVLAPILPDKFLSDQYAYKLHLLWLLHKKNARIHELPIQFVDRQQGMSKLPTNSIGDALRVIFKLRLEEMKRFWQ
ncbi:MAG: polyprenol monophosphomannose synthase [Gammaproteobacteria bacterium]|nr:polyprenol monophosphomannose synthase [Gammaproteobacteria bacterium]